MVTCEEEPCSGSHKTGALHKSGKGKEQGKEYYKKKLGLYSNLDIVWKRKKRHKSKTSWRYTSMALS